MQTIRCFLIIYRKITTFPNHKVIFPIRTKILMIIKKTNWIRIWTIIIIYIWISIIKKDNFNNNILNNMRMLIIMEIIIEQEIEIGVWVIIILITHQV